MNITTTYLVYVDHGPSLGGVYVHETPADRSFDGACDEYAENREKGLEATVMRIDLPNGTKAGMAVDVTQDALERIRRRPQLRYGDWPEWLDPREPEEIEREAQIESRTAKMIRKQTEAAQ